MHYQVIETNICEWNNNQLPVAKKVKTKQCMFTIKITLPAYLFRLIKLKNYALNNKKQWFCRQTKKRAGTNEDVGSAVLAGVRRLGR